MRQGRIGKILSLIGKIGAILTFIYAIAWTFYKEFFARPLRISGYVSSVKDSLVPIKAKIKISRPLERETDTDNEGKFEFELKDAKAGKYLLIIQDKINQQELDTVVTVTEDNDKNSFLFVFAPNIQASPDTGAVFRPVRVRNTVMQSSIEATQEQVDAVTPRIDFGIIAALNGKRNFPIEQRFASWLQRNGATTESISGNLPSFNIYLKAINSGDYSRLGNTKDYSHRYACLVNVHIEYSKSSVHPSLIAAKCLFEILIVDTRSGIVTESFEHPERADDISEEKARQRAEAAFYEFLENKQILTK